MGNNNLKTTNDILVKVDQNNLIYLDPNSVLINGVVEPRSVQPENLVMYVNLEADLIPRSILVNGDNKNTLISIAKGSLNFMQNKDGSDFDSKWTDSYTNIKAKSGNDSFFQNDETGQSFGITDISIQVAGANFIPRVVIKFVDVRGKTLFESPENSPYSAFFHLPWPIFYLTVKGYYGKAIKYRLHMIKFNSRYNDNNGNFEVECNFVGSTYAYLADISLEAILNAPYFYASENVITTKYNEETKFYDKTISKTTKGYRVLRSVYQEYINKGLLPKNFPVKTLREIIVIAGSLNKILEREIFSKIINHNILSGVKEYEDTIVNFEQSIQSWKGKYLSSEWFSNGTKRRNPISGESDDIRWFKLSGQDKNSLNSVIGPTKTIPLDRIIANYVEILEKNEAFGEKRKGNFSVKDKIKTKTISCAALKNIKTFYITAETVGIDMDWLLDCIYNIQKDFVEQRNKLEADIEKQMNEIIKKTDIGIGFEPTIRNIIGVILANAETYIRLMKDVHYKAFEHATERNKILSSVLTDSVKQGDAIYPWPEIKTQTGGKEMVLVYPGSREMAVKLQTDNKTIWPEVDFVENFFEISTKRVDSLSDKEGDTDNVNYIFDSTVDTNKKDISVLTNLMNYIPYSDKSVSSILYEIYERAKYTTSLSPFSNAAILELSNIEYGNLKDQVIDDIEVVDMLKNNIKDYPTLLTQMQSVSAFERYPYYEDQLPTVSYIKDGLSQDYNLQKYDGTIQDTISSSGEYTKVSEFLLNYMPESYRKSIYPFNSSTYTTYLNQGSFTDSNLGLNGLLGVSTPTDFIASPVNPLMWVNYDLRLNIFQNTIKINGIDKHILNTPYFHKQLYDDFTKVQPQEKYVGSAYLLLNSLPFRDLDEKVKYGGPGDTGALVSSLFREIGATHYLPYHMILKWGSIYHRYKKWINESTDIIANVTNMIDGALFFDGDGGTLVYDAISGKTVNRTLQKDIGFHPYYDEIFHQIVNGYAFYDTTLGPSGYTETITNQSNKLYYQDVHGANAWTSFIDNSVFGYSGYTLLPCNGYNNVDGSDFTLSEQENFRTIWNIGTSDTSLIDYTSNTFPSYDEYFKLTGTTDTYSLGTNYRKVIDLIATFKPDILDIFEQAFLDFASEKLNEEVSYKLYDVKYDKFQTLLQKIVSVTKDTNDPTDLDGLIKTVKEKQVTELQYLTNELLSNDNLIRFSMGNPREIDNYMLGGFTGVDVKHFSVSPYTSPDPSLIELYLGKDMDGYYHDFFITHDIEENEENIKQFRPLIYMYAGLRADGQSPDKTTFVSYINNTIVSPTKNSVTGVSGQNDKLNTFLDNLILKIQSKDFDIKSEKDKSIIKRGYNDDPIKLELYNYFKSFNDKWTSGNSIGQRTLMEEFLFLDKANRDIGNSLFLDMEKIHNIMSEKNEKINLYSLITLLIKDSGLDIRALPAYVNFYGANYSNVNKITPSKNVAQNMFGSFLDVDFQESSPKIILQYVGPTSKHLELSEIDNKYKYKDDGFDIGNVNKNPIIVGPDIFTKTDFSKSNKVVAFEVSFGDQNQSIFKGVELDQSSIKNTSESFEVLERLGRSETGASTAQVDIGLFDIYRQSSYSCQVTAMGNVMIQPTMYFYLKNIPLFKGSYWITEVTHTIRTTGIVTTFKGTRIPQQSLPNPRDSFLASYRSLFDKLIKRATVKVKEEHQALSGTTNNEKVVVTSSGTYSYNSDNMNIPGESLVSDAGITEYGIRYNGFEGEKNIQLVNYNGGQWLRARAVLMGGKYYKPSDDVNMNIVSRLKTGEGIDQAKSLTWKDVKALGDRQDFYVSKFDINRGIKPDDLIKNYTKTEFIHPKKNLVDSSTNVNVTVITHISSVGNKYEGPISVGPTTPATLDLAGYLTSGYGIGLSKSLFNKLNLYEGDVVYFKMS
jgi:hypothetical protein